MVAFVLMASSLESHPKVGESDGLNEERAIDRISIDEKTRENPTNTVLARHT